MGGKEPLGSLGSYLGHLIKWLGIYFHPYGVIFILNFFSFSADHKIFETNVMYGPDWLILSIFLELQHQMN